MARLLFAVVEGRDGQWWRGLPLVALTGLLGVAMIGVLALTDWVGGAIGLGSLATGGAFALSRHRRRTPR